MCPSVVPRHSNDITSYVCVYECGVCSQLLTLVFCLDDVSLPLVAMFCTVFFDLLLLCLRRLMLLSGSSVVIINKIRTDTQWPSVPEFLQLSTGPYSCPFTIARKGTSSHAADLCLCRDISAWTDASMFLSC